MGFPQNLFYGEAGTGNPCVRFAPSGSLGACNAAAQLYISKSSPPQNSARLMEDSCNMVKASFDPRNLETWVWLMSVPENPHKNVVSRRVGSLFKPLILHVDAIVSRVVDRKVFPYLVYRKVEMYLVSLHSSK